MWLTEITYSKGQTLQLRQFEPTNVHFSAKMELEETDDYHKGFEELKKIVDSEIDLTVKMLQEPQRVSRAGAKEVINKDLAKTPF